MATIGRSISCCRRLVDDSPLAAYLAQPLPQITVDEMLGDSSTYENNEVHVRGIVKPESISDDGNTFILAGAEVGVFGDATGIAVPEGLMEALLSLWREAQSI